MTPLKEHDRVVLTRALPAERLVPGDVGTIVHAYPDGLGYEVEFITLMGNTVAVMTLEAAQVRSPQSREIPHARELATV